MSEWWVKGGTFGDVDLDLRARKLYDAVEHMFLLELDKRTEWGVIGPTIVYELRDGRAAFSIPTHRDDGDVFECAILMLSSQYWCWRSEDDDYDD